MDIVVAVGSESVDFMSHITPCLHSNRIFMYVSSGNGQYRSLTKHSGKGYLKLWLQEHKDNIYVSEIANTWSGTEASAFSLHIAMHYYDMAPKTIFLHAHDGSWHSDKVCDIVRKARAVSAETTFLNLNRPFPLRCLSPSNVVGVAVSSNVRDFYYANWRKWTNSSPPKRIVFECCAQFLASKYAIQKRPLYVWTNILRAIVHDRIGNNWEYLWPTLIDQDKSSQSSNCR